MSVSIKYHTWRNIHPSSSYFRSHSTKPPYLLLICQSYWMNCWPPKFRKKSALIDKANDALKLVEQIAHPLANTRGNKKKVIIETKSFYKNDSLIDSDFCSNFLLSFSLALILLASRTNCSSVSEYQWKYKKDAIIETETFYKSDSLIDSDFCSIFLFLFSLAQTLLALKLSYFWLKMGIEKKCHIIILSAKYQNLRPENKRVGWNKMKQKNQSCESLCLQLKP